MKLAKLLQPLQFEAFHCIGAECEDTCCAGWNVHIDKPTYDKYQTVSVPDLEPRLSAFIAINDKATDEEDYARIVLTAGECPFLSDALCSIQQRLGEEYL